MIILVIGIFLTIGPMLNLFSIQVPIQGYTTLISAKFIDSGTPIRSAGGYTVHMIKPQMSGFANLQVYKSSVLIGTFTCNAPYPSGPYIENWATMDNANLKLGFVCYTSANNYNPAMPSGSTYAIITLAVKSGASTPVTPTTSCTVSGGGSVSSGETIACANTNGCPGKMTCNSGTFSACVLDNPSCTGGGGGVVVNQICTAGQTQDCAVGSCAGIKTCLMPTSNAWGDCVQVDPSCGVCSNNCSSGQLQKAYPDCSCYTPTCTNTCPSDQSQRPYPDCSCYTLDKACTSACENGCVGEVKIDCTTTYGNCTLSGAKYCENGTLGSCIVLVLPSSCTTCSDEAQPVCAGNFNTYLNLCHLQTAGQIKLFDGKCPTDIQWLGMALILIALIWLVIVMLKW